MSTGISLFLIALGAILYFAVTGSVEGISVSSAGVVLMAVGAVGFVWSMFLGGSVMGRYRGRGRRRGSTPEDML